MFCDADGCHLARWYPWREEVDTSTNVLRHAKGGGQGVYGSSTVSHDGELRDVESLTYREDVIYRMLVCSQPSRSISTHQASSEACHSDRFVTLPRQVDRA